MSLEGTKEQMKKDRARSIYPRFNLESAVKFAKIVFDHGGSRVPAEVVAGKLGKALTNSTYSGQASSAKQFGLLNQDGSNFSITDLAKHIFLPLSDADKRSSLRKAFSEPALYKELIEKFRGKPLPERTSLANLLAYVQNKVEGEARDIAAFNFIRSAEYVEAIQNGILVLAEMENGLENATVVSSIAPENGTKIPLVSDSFTAPISPLSKTEHHIFDYAGGVKLIIPKSAEVDEAIQDGALKEIKNSLKQFAEKYVIPKSE